jgi:hypothetical protein
MTTLLILTARDQAIAAAWEAFCADVPMTWLQGAA